MRPFCLYLLVCLLLVGQSEAFGQFDDDEYRPGLIGRYDDHRGVTIDRVDPRVAFDWGSSRPDRRLADGPFDARWQGYLMSQTTGDYRLGLVVSGHAEVTLNGQVVLDADGDGVTLHQSDPLELAYDFHPLEIQYRRTGDQAKLVLYWSGPQFPVEPVGIRQLHHDPAETPGDAFARGHQLARSLRCSACHELPGHDPPIAAPALNRIRGHLSREWLERWLTEPAERFDEQRRMPHFGLGHDDARAITAFLFAQSEPPPVSQPEPDRPAPKKKGRKERGKRTVDPIEAGRDLFLSVGCLACHQLGDLGQTGLFAAGALDQVADKRPARYFASWLRDPQQLNHDHRMPVFALSDTERRHLGAFLGSLGTPGTDEAEGQEPARRELLDHGRRLVEQHRCGACHRLAADQPPGLARLRPLAAAADTEDACWGASDPIARRPGYRLDEADREALRTYIATIVDGTAPAPSDELLVERNCLACHSRGLAAGLATTVAAVASHHPRLAPQTPALTPPALDAVGDKMQAEALQNAMRRRGEPHRDYLLVRMPEYRLSDQELTSLADYFRTADQVPTDTAEPPTEPDPVVMTSVGRRLVTPDGFGCTSCHQLGDVKPAKAPLNARGPDLSEIGRRVRREWFERFVKNPLRMVPRMEMPSVRLAVRGVLDDQLDQQLAAVWHVMNLRGFQPPRPDPIRIVRQSGLGGNRAVVVTDVVRAGDRTFVKPLLMGLPNRHNVLFDLQTSRLALWSLGDVARQHTEGKTWFWEAAGSVLIDSARPSPELAFQTPGEDEWISPDSSGQFVTEFDEVSHLDGGIGFRHRLHVPVAGGFRTVTASQSFHPLAETPGGMGFERRLELTGLAPGARVRLATLESDGGFTIEARSARLPDRRASVALREPEAAVFGPDGYVVASADEDGTVEFVLDYRCALPVDRFLVALPVAEPPGPERLEVVPGFEATRLPMSSELMPTGLAWRASGDLVICSLKGRVWLARETASGLRVEPFSDELAAPYGVATRGDDIDVLNKYALLRLQDIDGDGRADRMTNVASGWGHTADYHDWAVGLSQDDEGNYYAALPCQQDNRSPEAARLRGRVLRMRPRQPSRDRPELFSIEPITGGHRFPMGLARSRSGDLFVTDNQGNYNPFNELNHVVAGRRYGFINSLERKPGFQPDLTEPAIDIPHPWTRSVNGICFLDTPGDAPEDGLFGPFEGHLIGCEYDTRRLIRMSLQRVDGEFQGAAYPFSYDEPPSGPPLLGPLVAAVSPRGDLYVGGIRDSGWGGANNIGEIVRLRPRLQELPCGIAEVRATHDGFTVEFTRPVDRESARASENYVISSYTRVSTPAYGGPDVDRQTESVRGLTVSPDGGRVKIQMQRMREGYVYEIRLKNLAGESRPFFPSEAYYTLRRVPAGRPSH